MKKLALVLLFGFSSLFAFEELNVDNFDQKISEGNVIVDFYAVWWSSCEVLGQNLHTYYTSKNPNVKIYKVNIDEQKALIKKYKVRIVPDMIYFKDSKQVLKTLGVKSVKELEELEKKYF